MRTSRAHELLAEALSGHFENLNKIERRWVERYDFLESRGYRLRPRFRPGWVPSWHRTGQNPLYCEDSRFHRVQSIMDATRLSDGRQVVLKAVHREGDELKIVLMLSSPEAIQDPANHCVPILDYISDPNSQGPDFIVMPLLRTFNDPQFYTISEALDFVHQTLEGLAYIHERGVAHRDLTDANILMDASELYPDGTHPDPLWDDLLPDQYVKATPLRRRDVENTRYYFIDFGISSYFNDASEPRLVTGIDGRDREVPELDLKKPYDPFPVDVFTLGNTYKRIILSFSNFDFLMPLVEEMTNMAPENRPTAKDALARFHQLTNQLDYAFLNKRLRPKNEPIIVHYIHELSSSFAAFLLTLKRIFARRNVGYVVIPVGLSLMLLYRGSHSLSARLRSLFIGFHASRN